MVNCLKKTQQKKLSFVAYLIFYVASKERHLMLRCTKWKIKMAISMSSLCKYTFACAFGIFRGGKQRATRKSRKQKEKSSRTACSLNILKTRLPEEHE